MKFWLGLLFLLSNVSLAASASNAKITGQIKDVDLCGDVLLETVCNFEVPDLTRRRRRLGANQQANDKNNNMDSVIRSCKIKLDGEDMDSTVTAVDSCELKFDETLRGDDTRLLMYTSLVKLDDSDIKGLVKLEAFEYDNQNPDSNQALTTIKTFSITWSGC